MNKADSERMAGILEAMGYREAPAELEADLVLLDLVLPEQDGFEVLEKVRAEKSLDKVKMIVFSNLSQQEEKQKAKDLGANDFIVKSELTPQQVVERVKGYFAETEQK